MSALRWLLHLWSTPTRTVVVPSDAVSLLATIRLPRDQVPDDATRLWADYVYRMVGRPASVVDVYEAGHELVVQAVFPVAPGQRLDPGPGGSIVVRRVDP